MAATYGYGGEFSSDEDIDKMEQQSERLIQSKFDTQQVKPTKRQIEEAIETIKQLPVDQDVQLTDELLAGLLDHYKTQRGPIVDSTRNLYKKIILRLIREGQLQQQQQQQQQVNNGDSAKETNNNNGNVIKKLQPTADLASSDEDEPMPPVSSLNKFQSSVINTEPMEVDSETPGGPIRSSRPVDMSSSESETEDSETEESSSDSEVLDVTPIKQAYPQVPTKTVGPIKPTTVVGAKSSELIKKPQLAAATGISSTPVDPKKKPYTRSQRVVATRAGSARVVKKTDVSSSKDTSSDEVVKSKASDSGNKSAQSSRFKVRYFIFALFIAVLAFAFYYFRSELTLTTNRIVSRAIKF